MQRVSERWGALIERDFPKAYQYESPGYRKVYSAEGYQGSFGDRVAWETARVAQAEIDAQRADVRVQVAYKTVMPDLTVVDGSRYLQETWIKEDGTWYHVKH
jgi:hypothetical protein